MLILPAEIGPNRHRARIHGAPPEGAAQAAARLRKLAGIAEDIAALTARGVEVIVVSSGAIALARRRLKLTAAKLRLEEKQAAASVGQIRLAQAWS